MNSNNLKIIKSIVRGYNKIALKFHHTRLSFFRDLKFVKNYVPKNATVLDFGCGNGRLAEFLKGSYKKYQGLDVSKNLIKIAQDNHRGKKTQFKKIRPFEKLRPFYNSFDIVFSIAVFHHFPSQKYRKERAEELFRVLKPEGIVVVSVWNLWQKKYFKEILREALRKIAGSSKLGWGDLVVSFKEKSFVFKRYHHAYTQKSLKRLFEKAGFTTVKTINTGRNIVYIGKKE